MESNFLWREEEKDEKKIDNIHITKGLERSLWLRRKVWVPRSQSFRKMISAKLGFIFLNKWFHLPNPLSVLKAIKVSHGFSYRLLQWLFGGAYLLLVSLNWLPKLLKLITYLCSWPISQAWLLFQRGWSRGLTKVVSPQRAAAVDSSASMRGLTSLG